MKVYIQIFKLYLNLRMMASLCFWI